jgi:hypothetical protein
MKTVKNLILGIVLLGIYSQIQAQSCSAAFLDNKMIVNEYTPEGKCFLKLEASGTLIVAETELFDDGRFNITNKIGFMVAIRDKNTKTLTMYSTEVFPQADIRPILAKCQKGDSIVLLTMKKDYALPHNEILIQ